MPSMPANLSRGALFDSLILCAGINSVTTSLMKHSSSDEIISIPV